MKSATAKSPVFDARSFVKYMKITGRVYRNQAMSLISICQIFIKEQEQTFRSYDELRSVYQLVDDALQSAAGTQSKKSEEADNKFKMAVEALSRHEKKKSPSRETVATTMEAAKARDKSSLTFLNKMKEKLPRKLRIGKSSTDPQPPVEVPTRTVEFLIHKSLPDRNPTVVKMVLSQHASLPEVLWNFSRFKGEKRLTLKQNPHFYEMLPISPEKYGGKFTMDPIRTFQHQKISVLIDNLGPAGRVFFETAKETRVFGNAWLPKDAIIFKDVHGRLEGESIVGETFRDTHNIRCYEEREPPLSVSRASLPSNRNSPSLNVTGTQIASVATILKGDWREPIHRMLRSPDVNIRITAKPPGTSATN